MNTYRSSNRDKSMFIFNKSSSLKQFSGVILIMDPFFFFIVGMLYDLYIFRRNDDFSHYFFFFRSMMIFLIN